MENHTDALAQGREFAPIKLVYIVIEHRNQPARRADPQKHELHQGCLARAAGAAEEMKGAGIKRKVNVTQYFRPNAISQSYMFKFNQAVYSFAL